MTSETTLFENEHYYVEPGPFQGEVTSHGGKFVYGYLVISKATEVTEIMTPQLPDAIAAAEQLDISMETETWKWIRIQAGPTGNVNPDGTPADDVDIHGEDGGDDEPEIH